MAVEGEFSPAMASRQLRASMPRSARGRSPAKRHGAREKEKKVEARAAWKARAATGAGGMEMARRMEGCAPRRKSMTTRHAREGRWAGGLHAVVGAFHRGRRGRVEACPRRPRAGPGKEKRCQQQHILHAAAGPVDAAGSCSDVERHVGVAASASACPPADAARSKSAA